MNDNVIELIAALDKLSSAANEFEAQAAVNRLKHAFSDETTESDREEAQFRLRDKVWESVLSDALADYDEHSELYPERVLTLHNTVPVVMGKIPRAEFKEEDVLALKDILPRFGELASCKTGKEIRAFVDSLSARFEQHPEYREAGYRRLLCQISKAILDTLRASPEWGESSAATKLRADYLTNLLADGLLGLTETEGPLLDTTPIQDLMSAMTVLHKLCVQTDPDYIESNWSDFLGFMAGCPDTDSLSMQAFRPCPSQS